MNSRVSRLQRLFSIVACFSFVLGVKVARAGETCAGTSPYVCVERADLNSPGPEEGQDFAFDVFTDPANPDVWFKTGSTTPWRVWSQVSASDTTPANLGDLFIDSSGSTDNYTVEILNPNECSGGVCTAGAANLKSAVLDDTTNWTGHSSITDGMITGDLAGALSVTASAGSGGELLLTIDGDLDGAITAPTVLGLEIHGDIHGDINVTTIVEGNITVHGGVGGSSRVRVEGLAPSAKLSFNFSLGPNLIKGNFTINADFDYDNWLLLAGDFTGDVTINGEMDGIIVVGGVLDSAALIDLNGSIAALGIVAVVGQMHGTVDVRDNVDGDVIVESDMDGDILVGGDNNGVVNVGGDMDGDIRISGDCTYQVWVAQSLTANGRILIDGFIGGAPLSRVIISRGTVAGSSIRATKGIKTNATVFVNFDQLDFDARGSMYFGDASTLALEDVTFDGAVLIHTNPSGGYGRLYGSLTVDGCHHTADLLDICICGSGSPSSPVLYQWGCATKIPSPFWTCSTGCP